MQNLIKQNLLQIQEQIAPFKPNIIAVTKYFDENAIIAAYNAGIRDFAESRAIEAIKKINNLPDEVKRNSRFHFIGHLQTNKVKKVVAHFDLIHSVDSLKLAETISEEAEKINKVQHILLQLNNANEEQKFGFSKDELEKNFSDIIKLPHVKVLGLMNMAPINAEDKVLSLLFSDVKNTLDALNKKFNCNMTELSMGMSQDYRIAAQCGATMLRIGRKLFSDVNNNV